MPLATAMLSTAASAPRTSPLNPQGNDQYAERNSLPLPIDIFLDIFVYLSLHDVLNLRQTCTSFLAITHMRSVWLRLLRTQALEHHLPIFGARSQELDSLSAEELEQRLRHALRLRRNWSSFSPSTTREVSIATPRDPFSRSIFLEFLPGRGNKWLISITMAGTSPRKFTIQCWDITATEPACVAVIERLGPLGGVVINSDPGVPAILAMQFSNTEIFTIDFMANDSANGFVSLMEIEGSRALHAFRGSKIVSRYANGDVTIWDVSAPEQEIELQNSEHIQAERPQDVVLREEYVIIMRVSSIEIHAIPPVTLDPSAGATITITHPVVQHKWQWRTDTVCMSEQMSSVQSGTSHFGPINILVRFGSVFPWPINIIHHFILQPQPSYNPSVSLNIHNLPYLIKPRLMQSMNSPIRLFALSHIALGLYGTALFIDSHTEDYLGQSDHGQRLAGMVLTEASKMSLNTMNDDATEAIASNALATMVFGIKEHDEWTRVTMDEESGRIAVGCIDGGVSLFEYA